MERPVHPMLLRFPGFSYLPDTSEKSALQQGAQRGGGVLQKGVRHSVGRRGGNKSDCAAHGQRSGGADESAAEKYIYAATVRQVSTGCGALRKRKEAGIFYIRKQTQRR